MASIRSARTGPQRPVQPIRNFEDLERLRHLLKNKPRDLLLFDLATRTGLWMKDILKLKVKELVGLEVGDKMPLKSPQTNPPSAPTLD